MRCRDARVAIIEDRLGLLPDRASEGLALHLGACPACAAFAGQEAHFAATLRLLRTDPPPRVDVAERVMREVRVAAAPERAEVPVRHLGWAAGAWLALACVGVAAALALAPQILEALRAGARVVLDSTGALAPLFRVVTAALSSGATAARGLWGAASSLAAVARKAEPLAIGAAVVSVAAMLAVTSYVVRRDLRRFSPARR